tara:strand:- start:31 stop:294 length:264 start_codon:yes stop_codon:yes gene_type:complete
MRRVPGICDLTLTNDANSDARHGVGDKSATLERTEDVGADALSIGIDEVVATVTDIHTTNIHHNVRFGGKEDELDAERVLGERGRGS